MTLYRKLATDTLDSIQNSRIWSAQSRRPRSLKPRGTKTKKALQKNAPDVWNQIDKAHGLIFIKPMQDKAPDAAKVQTAYDTFNRQAPTGG